MVNFCTNCGAKIRNGDKFCTNCGTKIYKSVKQKNSLFKSVTDSIEKNTAKLNEELDRIDQENEEKKKKLKTLDEIFESDEIKSEIRKNKAGPSDVSHIKDILKNKIVNKKENLSNAEIKSFIKKELKNIRIAKEKELERRRIEETTMHHGGYCSMNCRHYYEEFFDSGGGIVGDFDCEGYTEYYCNLGHQLCDGHFCEDYE